MPSSANLSHQRSVCLGSSNGCSACAEFWRGGLSLPLFPMPTFWRSHNLPLCRQHLEWPLLCTLPNYLVLQAQERLSSLADIGVCARARGKPGIMPTHANKSKITI